MKKWICLAIALTLFACFFRTQRDQAVRVESILECVRQTRRTETTVSGLIDPSRKDRLESILSAFSSYDCGNVLVYEGECADGRVQIALRGERIWVGSPLIDGEY